MELKVIEITEGGIDTVKYNILSELQLANPNVTYISDTDKRLSKRKIDPTQEFELRINYGIFKKLFGSHTKLELVDSDLGHFDSDYIKGSDVTWIGSAKLFGKTIEVLMDGNPEKLSPNQKRIAMNALSNEDILRSESSTAISEEYSNADMKFMSLDEQLEVKAITSNEDGFELSFEQKESPYFYFNVFFENNKQQGVSIDS